MALHPLSPRESDNRLVKLPQNSFTWFRGMPTNNLPRAFNYTGPSGGSNTWLGCEWIPEKRLYVAVGTNCSASSRNGVNWVSSVSPGNVAWEGMAWSPELSRLVISASSAAGNDLAYSSDGVNFTSLAGFFFSAGVCWSSEQRKFVLVMYSGATRSWTSPDGITWTAGSLDAGDTWQKVCWSPKLGLYAIVGFTNGLCRTSPDGITWTSRTLGGFTWRDVIWSPELSMFVCSGAGGMGYSRDGKTWFTSPLTGTWYRVRWSSLRRCLVAVSSTVANIAISYDGVRWVTTPAPNVAMTALAYSRERDEFVAVANAGGTSFVL